MKPTERVSSHTYIEYEVQRDNVTGTGSQFQIEELADELVTIAEALRETKPEVKSETAIKKNTLNLAASILHARVQVSEIMDSKNLTVGPILDILLDMYICECVGRTVSTTDAAVASRCAPTTGLRWVNVMENAKLLQKSHDVTDQRRMLLSLTADGRELALRCIAAYAPV